MESGLGWDAGLLRVVCGAKSSMSRSWHSRGDENGKAR
jgi:hypothetical protein